MIISSIVACAHNKVIGRKNEIPWYLPADLKFFKKVTSGHPVIMGRKCFESIGRPLPNRTNIIITRDPYYIVSNCLIAHSSEEAIRMASEMDNDEIFIIGGGEIYNQTIHYWHKIYLTEVDLDVPDGDTFFPALDFSKWERLNVESHLPDEQNKYPYQFSTWMKKTSKKI